MAKKVCNCFVFTPDPKVVESRKSMKVSDFALENIVAAGAVHMLKPTQLDGNLDTTIENVGKLVEALDSIEVPEEN